MSPFSTEIYPGSQKLPYISPGGDTITHPFERISTLIFLSKTGRVQTDAERCVDGKMSTMSSQHRRFRCVCPRPLVSEKFVSEVRPRGCDMLSPGCDTVYLRGDSALDEVDGGVHHHAPLLRLADGRLWCLFGNERTKARVILITEYLSFVFPAIDESWLCMIVLVCMVFVLVRHAESRAAKMDKITAFVIGWFLNIDHII